MKSIDNSAKDTMTLARSATPSSLPSADAQTWFSRGLTWMYSFSHVEGSYCSEQAIFHDPACVMEYSGLAYSVGPNYHRPWEKFDLGDFHTSVQRGHDAARAAKKFAVNANPLE
jgi:hypothetical protein